MARTSFMRVARRTLEQWRRARRRVLESGAGRGAVHDLRTCTRRLVALEALLAPRGGKRRHGSIDGELQPAFHASGRLRDAQLAARALRELSRELPSAARLARHEEHRVPRLGDRLQRALHAIHGARLERTVEGWLQPVRGDPEQVLARRATRRLRTELRWLQTAGHPDPASGARRLHRRRVRLKQLRYMAELAQLTGHEMPRFLDLTRLTALQQGFGAVTDLDMQLRVLARFAAEHPDWRAAARPLRQELRRRRATAVGQLGIRTYSSQRAAGA